MPQHISNKKYYLIFTLYFLAFGIIVALCTSIINYKSNLASIDSELQSMANLEAQFKRNLLFDYISRIEMLVSSITKNELTLKYITSKDSGDKNNLSKLLFALSHSNKDIMQLRYIDASGNEQIRIDRFKQTQELLLVSEDELQNKSERYYFKETAQLTPNQFWHSNIDLNMEHGKIEKPIKATFRVATKLVIDGEFCGIIIANIMFENTIKTLANSAYFNVYLADKDGEIIYHPDNSKSWSKYLGNKDNLHNIFPHDVSNIITHEKFNTTGLSSYFIGDLFRNSENLKIIFTPKSDTLIKMRSKNIQTVFLIALTVLLVSIPLSWLISIIPSRLQSKLSRAYFKIKKNTNIIDEHVILSKTDKDGVIIDVSTCFTRITGYTAAEVIGKEHNILRHPDTTDDMCKNIWDTILKGKTWKGDIKNRDKSGKDFWLHQIITVDFDNNGDIDGFTLIAQDITDKKNIERMSVTDSLTGLYNRHKLEDALSSNKARFDRYNIDFSVIIFDVDLFKIVNDTHGHQVGDSVLVELANIFKENARGNDYVSRWGGEEFLIIAEGINLDAAFLFADKLRDIIEHHTFAVIGNITISCGVAQYLKGETTSDLVSRADIALYEAKKQGRNRVVKSMAYTKKIKLESCNTLKI